MAGPNAGRAGSRWRRLSVQVRARHDRCCRCGQTIDYFLSNPHPGSFSVDHYPHPLSTHRHLAEDPSNLAAAHLRCNIGAGNKGVMAGAGVTSEDW